MNKKLAAARRELERLEWEHARAERAGHEGLTYDLEPQIRDARWRVQDLEAADRNEAVVSARRTARILDGSLVVDAGLVMAFSLGNIHAFATAHGVTDPIAWLVAPMVDVALVAVLSADSFLSRNGHDGGVWAVALRWFAGVATLALNTWHAIVSGDFAGVVLHGVPPLLLVLLAEAAPHYRRGAAAVVAEVERQTATATGPAPTVSEEATVQAETAEANAPEAESDPEPERKPVAPKKQRPATPKKQTPGAGRNARPVKDDATVLAELEEMRRNATEPLAVRNVCQEIGIGQRRLDGLMEREGVSLDPIPAEPDAYDGFEVADPWAADDHHGLRAVPDLGAAR